MELHDIKRQPLNGMFVMIAQGESRHLAEGNGICNGMELESHTRCPGTGRENEKKDNQCDGEQCYNPIRADSKAFGHDPNESAHRWWPLSDSRIARTRSWAAIRCSARFGVHGEPRRST